TASGPTDLQSGGHVVLTAHPGTGFTYQWLKDGADINNVKGSSYTATQSGSYSVKIFASNYAGQVSAAIPVSVTFAVPASNYKITNTSATCNGSANGVINITAVQNLNYTATVINSSGITSTYPFTTSVDVNNLPADSYSVCITVAGQPAYQQCFTSVITQPGALSLYSSVIRSTNQAILSLSGADTYHLAVNGVTTTTTSGQLTVSLKTGNNTISLSSDKACQGVVNENILIADSKVIFPNPFVSSVSVNLGNDNVKVALIKVYDAFSKVVYSKQYVNQSGIVRLDLPVLKSGIYMAKVTADGKESTYKIVKN
ncbi:MAG: T9SS type A sorting domain-containing protein, partial [Mucilaginibacter sp.]